MAFKNNDKKEAVADHWKHGTIDEMKEVDLSRFDDHKEHSGGARKLDVKVDQDQVLYDQDTVGVNVIGSQPVTVELDTKVKQKGKMDQDEKVKVDDGNSGGHDTDIRTDQRVDVDQRIAVEVEVSEKHGVIFVEIGVDIDDDISIESDADIKVRGSDKNKLDTDNDQDIDTNQDIDVDVEIRDDLNAHVNVDVVPLIQAAVRAAVAATGGHDVDSIVVDLDELAAALGNVQIVVDVSEVDL
jgi:hypothetical protein